MRTAREKRTAELVTIAFDRLCRYPDGEVIEAVLNQVERDCALDENEKIPNRYHGFKPFEEAILMGTIALISAGWVLETDGRWLATPKGVTARSLCSTPDSFYRSVARESFKSWLIVRLPKAFSMLSRLLNQYHIEINTLKRLGWRFIVTSLIGPAPRWRRALPLQKPLRYELPELAITSYEALERHLKSSGLVYSNAGHTFYLPPQSARLSAFGSVMQAYPPDAGLKIVKRQGGAQDPYLFGDIRNRRISVWYNWITYNRDLLLLVANLFDVRGIGPRIFDLIEINCGGSIWSAYVVEHVTGRLPSMAECQAGIDEIKQLESEGLVKLTLTEGYQDQDLTPPACNNNAIVDQEGRFRYVDFQSFVLTDYQKYLAELAERCFEPEVDGVLGRMDSSVRPKPTTGSETVDFVRDWKTSARLKAIGSLLGEAGIQVKDRLLLDLDGGDALTFAHFLGQGARWCHGWRNSASAADSENLLRALGCTRFSVGKSEQPSSTSFDTHVDIPDFLEPLIDGCVVLCSAPGEYVNRSILERIGWSYVISTTANQYVSSAYTEKSKVTYRDRDSHMKTVVLLENKQASLSSDEKDFAVGAEPSFAVSRNAC